MAEAKHAAPEAMEELIAEESKGKKKKIAGIVAASVVGVAAVVYLGGALLFSRTFLPSTTINGKDYSLTSSWSFSDGLTADTKGYKLNITGDGLDLTVNGSDIDLVVDSEAITNHVMEQQNPWTWPFEIANSHELSYETKAAFNEEKLKGIIDPVVEKSNTEVFSDSANAYVAFNGETQQFEIVPEVYGSTLKADQITEAASELIVDLKPELVLDEKFLTPPEVLKDDERLINQLNTANTILAANIELTMDGKPITTVTGAQCASLIQVSPEGFTVNFDDEAFRNWSKGEFASKYDTTHDEKTYTRYDGKQITLPGDRSTYGWIVNSEELTESLLGGIKAGYQGQYEVPVKQRGDHFTAKGQPDWGNAYIDVDLSEQHARYYDANGTLAWETDVVTGDTTLDHGTPVGAFFVNDKETNTVLVSQDIDPVTGKPEYESPVARWMPFLGGSWGLHDASWRYSFGGSIYQGYGSHGCVNLPVDKAYELFDMIYIGMPVLIHW